VAVVAATMLLLGWSYLRAIATAPRPRGDCRTKLVVLIDAVRNHVKQGRSLDESVREVESSGLSLECDGKPIRLNPDLQSWTDAGIEHGDTLLIATAVFEGKETILDVEGEPFCYGIDAHRNVHGIPVGELPDWAR
jgi:hypothetical protein